MYSRTPALFGVVALSAITVAACVGASKSANPLSPTVAGPLPGVNMNPPNPMTPVSTRIPVDQQPVTLTVTNGGTNSIRTVTISFEVATDVGFANKVFTRDGVTPSASGQTSLKLPDPLATGHTYYWRSKEGDGANASDYSNVAGFDVYTPVVIQPPVLVAPVGNATTDTVAPRFTFTNAPRSGPAGPITYVIEVADSSTFANKVAIWTIGESAGQSSLDAPGSLPANQQLFWHVRAADPSTLGPFSATAVFKTPNIVVAPPPPSGGGGGGGNYLSLDQINLSAAHIVGGGPSDVANWSVTTPIQHVTFDPGLGLSFTSPALSYWPDQLIPGWNGGTLQYTVWACVNQGGWSCAGFIQMWLGRTWTGAPLPSNSVYWWGPGGGVTANVFGGFVGQPGDTMAFFITAGNERGGTFSSVRERSNVVLVTLPYGDSGSFSY